MKRSSAVVAVVVSDTIAMVAPTAVPGRRMVRGAWCGHTCTSNDRLIYEKNTLFTKPVVYGVCCAARLRGAIEQSSAVVVVVVSDTCVAGAAAAAPGGGGRWYLCKPVRVWCVCVSCGGARRGGRG